MSYKEEVKGVAPAEKAPEKSPEEMGIFKREELIKKEGEPGAKVLFLSVVHTEEWAKDVAKVAESADVIAVELVGETKENRLIMEFIAHAATTKTDSNAEERIRRAMSNVFSSGFLVELITAFRGTGKRFVFVDAAEEDFEYRHSDEFEQAIADTTIAMYTRPWEEALEVFKKRGEITAGYVKERDQLVASQVMDLVKEEKDFNRNYPGKSETKIAVIQGLGHTATSHMVMNEPGIDAERTFVPELGNDARKFSEGAKLVHSHSEEILMRMRFFPDKKIPQELFEKGMLSEYFGGSLGEFSPRLITSAETQLFLRKVVDDFSGAERRELLSEISHTVEEGGNKIEKYIPGLVETLSKATSVRPTLDKIKRVKAIMLSTALSRSVNYTLGTEFYNRFGVSLPRSEAEVIGSLEALEQRKKTKETKN